ncbi:MAG TPA: DUF29 domain-containing protein [Pirellulales bacterium]|jgi:hypothetical protein|nr:DUF29 domain-containing protein [Pirellulales bacterium]
MSTTQVPNLRLLYERDETAWLEAMAALAASGQYADMDFEHLSEYLAAMVKRDQRELFSRLVVLLSHLLKCEYQPEHRSGSWRRTILEQQRELRQLFESGTLRKHALAVFADAYADARKEAAAETGLARTAFPEQSPWSLDRALEYDDGANASQ